MYVSRAQPGWPGDPMVQDIVDRSLERNAALKITGTLLYTGEYFAQVIEGPDEAVIQIFNAIEHDRRHRDVTVVDREQCTERMFNSWTMAYTGRATYIARPIRTVLENPATSPVSVSRIYTIMSEFTKNSRDH